MNTSRPTCAFTVRRTLRPLVLSLLLLPVLASINSASAQEEHRLSIDQVIVSEESEQITALVSVLDPAGQPVLGLTTFNTAIDGAAVPPESVQPVLSQEAGIAVLLLIDVSGSMAGEPLAQAQAAASTFVQSLLPQDVAALATFAGAAPGEALFTTDRGALLAGISQLQTESETGTALYDTVVNGLAAAAGAPTARRAVVLLTDGQDSGGVSERSRTEALNAAATVGLPIYVIGLGPAADIDFLQTLAQQAGGTFYQAPTPADVPAIFDAIGATLRSQYALTLALPRGERAGRELLVRLDLEEATLAARATFQAPGAVTEAGEGGGLPAWLGAVAGAGVALLLGLVVGRWFIRRRRQRSPVAGGPGQDISLTTRSQESPPTPALKPGKLTVIAGPNAGASIRLTSDPVDLGSSPASGLQLDAADGSVAGTHARAWLQGKRLMVHHLAGGRQTLIGDKAIEWATLEPNDTIRIGPHVIAFAIET